MLLMIAKYRDLLKFMKKMKKVYSALLKPDYNIADNFIFNVLSLCISLMICQILKNYLFMSLQF